QRVDIVSRDAIAWQTGRSDIVQPPGLGRETHDVKQRNGAEARHRGPEVLQFIRSRWFLDPFDYRYGPIVARDASNHPTQCAPLMEGGGRALHPDMQVRNTLCRQVKAVAGRTCRKTGR